MRNVIFFLCLFLVFEGNAQKSYFHGKTLKYLEICTDSIGHDTISFGREILKVDSRGRIFRSVPGPHYCLWDYEIYDRNAKIKTRETCSARDTPAVILRDKKRYKILSLDSVCGEKASKPYFIKQIKDKVYFISCVRKKLRYIQYSLGHDTIGGNNPLCLQYLLDVGSSEDQHNVFVGDTSIILCGYKLNCYIWTSEITVFGTDVRGVREISRQFLEKKSFLPIKVDTKVYDYSTGTSGALIGYRMKILQDCPTANKK